MARVATDISGQANHGTYQGGAKGAASLIPTDSNRATRFNGTSGFVVVDAVIADLAGSTAFAMGCWARPRTNRGDMALMIVNKGSGDYNRYLLQGAFSGGVGHYELNTAAVPGGSQLLTEPGNPHSLEDRSLVIANCGTSSQRLFVDGVSVGTSSYTGQTIGGSDRCSIGQDYDGPAFGNQSAWFPGVLDDAFVIPRQITPAEAADLYDAGASSGGFREAVLALGPIGYWRLDDWAGWRVGTVTFGG